MENLLQIAINEIGVKEIPGTGNNPQILNYARESGFPDYVSDDVAWCSLFMNWVAQKSGLERSKSLAARSWLNFGLPISNPEPGDVVVFWRGDRNSWTGHVGIFMGFSHDLKRIYCLGGNQGNQVSVTAYGAGKLLGFRRLRPDSAVGFSRKNLEKGDTGQEVIYLQDALKQLGFDPGTSDGVFGPKTHQALIDFQSTNNDLTRNGIFDKATREFLTELLNR
ncbi:TIGR02594 family protein [Algoriphagus sp.]|uniref:C40 family peptidase n=1 Tax=Algoriphagus sp. TaxID=1872435 RepID=UPI00262951A3|nr:TIGR02594 family protein [Algoriphagus sp.]